MAVQDAIGTLTDGDTLENVAYLAGGYVVTEQVTRRLVSQFANEESLSVPNEAYGVVTALGFYGYGDKVVSAQTAEMMGHGALLNAVDEFSNREAVRNMIGG